MKSRVKKERKFTQEELVSMASDLGKLTGRKADIVASIIFQHSLLDEDKKSGVFGKKSGIPYEGKKLEQDDGTSLKLDIKNLPLQLQNILFAFLEMDKEA